MGGIEPVHEASTGRYHLLMGSAGVESRAVVKAIHTSKEYKRL
jgi:hypothetical protein